MALTGDNPTPKQIQNRYRLVVINEDSFKEVVAFKLNRWSVYIALSAFFVILVGLTIALIAFTPIKYYIPGYGQAGKTQQYEMLQVKADSIERSLIMKQRYIDDIEKVLKGDVMPLDTTSLKVSAFDKKPIVEKVNKKSHKRKR